MLELLQQYARIKNQLPSAVLAGGALRDSLLNREVNDLDVFISERDESLATNLQNYTVTVFRTPDEIAQYKEFFGCNIKTIFDAVHFALPTPIQIIVKRDLSTIDKLISEFDYGFCKIAWNEKFTISPDFWEDINNKTVTNFYPNKNSSERFLQRKSRLQMKYPDWKFVDKTIQEVNVVSMSKITSMCESDVYF